MENNQAVFRLRHGYLLNPKSLSVTIPVDLNVSTHNGDLFLFPSTTWGALLDKLAAAKPSPERNAFLRMIGLAEEVEVSGGQLELPEPIHSRLGPNPAVLLAGKQIGIISRPT